jgi:hypothetical protein
LVPEDQQYVGKHAYVIGVPAGYDDWREQFVARTGYTRVLRLYFHHPSIPLSFLNRDLHSEAPKLRPIYLATYRLRDRAAPYQLAHHFDSWSNLRSGLFQVFPYHVVIWYLLVAVASVALALRSPSLLVRKTAVVVLALAVMGAMEFCFASLLDAEQADRHLILFHEITDITIWLAFYGRAGSLLRIKV